MAVLNEILSDSDSGSELSGSDFSFHDFDNDVEDDEDDILYQDNVDIGIEFAGVGSSPLININGLDLPCPKLLPEIDDDDFNECSGEDSEQLNSLEGSSEDDEGQRSGIPKGIRPRFKVSADMEDPKLEVGMIFSNGREFKDAVRGTAIAEIRNIWFPCNEPGRVRARCRGKNCLWFIYATVCDNGSFQIRTLNKKHTCGCALNSRHVNSTLLSKRYSHQLRMNSNIKAIDLQEQVLHDLHVSISRRQAYRTIKKGRSLDEVHFLDQYSLLNNYCAELVRTNPGSTVFLKTEEDEVTGEHRFLRFYCCLEPLKRGFLAGCRRVVGLDGCHLKGPHPGVILTAMGMDANNCIYPICYGVVETENLDTWRWFVSLLVEDLEINEPEMWVFITDKQKGLGIAIEELLPNVEHRHCVRHLHQNFKKKHGSFALKDKMWEAARATYVERFTKVMEVIRSMDGEAYEWLAKEHPRYWSRSHFRTNTHCDVLLNNMCESWNKQLLDARESSVLVCLERIRLYLLERLEKRRKWISRWQADICPKIRKIMNDRKKWASKWIPLHCGSNFFQVKGTSGAQFAVDLTTFTCACRGWDLSGIPCVHVISALSSVGLEPEEYTSQYFKTSTFKKAYEPYIGPINGPDLWPQTNGPKVLAPKGVKLCGRPKKKRDRAAGEDLEEKIKKSKRKANASGDVRIAVESVGRSGLKGKCSLCKQVGHNKRRCTRVSEAQSVAESGVNDSVELGGIEDQIPPTPIITPMESQSQSSSVVKVDKRRSNRLRNNSQVTENNVIVNATNSDVNINVANSNVNVDALSSELQVKGCKSKVEVDIDASEVRLDVKDSNVVVNTKVVSASGRRTKSKAQRVGTPSKEEKKSEVVEKIAESLQESKSQDARGDDNVAGVLTQASTNASNNLVVGDSKKRVVAETSSNNVQFMPNKRPCVELSKIKIHDGKDGFLPTGVKNLGQPSDISKRPPFRPGGMGVYTRVPTPLINPGSINLGGKKLQENPYLYNGKRTISLETLRAAGHKSDIDKAKSKKTNYDMAGVNEAFKEFDKNMSSFMQNLLTRGSSSKGTGKNEDNLTAEFETVKRDDTKATGKEVFTTKPTLTGIDKKEGPKSSTSSGVEKKEGPKASTSKGRIKKDSSKSSTAKGTVKKDIDKTKTPKVDKKKVKPKTTTSKGNGKKENSKGNMVTLVNVKKEKM